MINYVQNIHIHIQMFIRKLKLENCINILITKMFYFIPYLSFKDRYWFKILNTSNQLFLIKIQI
jgi:DUF1365 family protein